MTAEVIADRKLKERACPPSTRNLINNSRKDSLEQKKWKVGKETRLEPEQPFLPEGLEDGLDTGAGDGN